MPNWLANILLVVYRRIPLSARPTIKRIFVGTLLRIQALLKLRSIKRGRRVEFLGFEIAVPGIL